MGGGTGGRGRRRKSGQARSLLRSGGDKVSTVDFSASAAPLLVKTGVDGGIIIGRLNTCSPALGDRLHRGDDAGALSDFDQAVSLSGGAKGEYFVQRARARARVAMRSNGREEAMAGVQVGTFE